MKNLVGWNIAIASWAVTLVLAIVWALMPGDANEEMSKWVVAFFSIGWLGMGLDSFLRAIGPSREPKGPFVVFMGPPNRMNDDPNDLWDLVLRGSEGSPLEFSTATIACAVGREELSKQDTQKGFFWGVMSVDGEIYGSSISANLS